MRGPFCNFFLIKLLLLSSLSWTAAQDYIVQSQFYGIEEGLSHRDVQSIHQDEQGILWLGTRYGLNRFDGYNFKWYTKETHGFQSNIINHVREDQDGNLWLFDTDGFHFKTIQNLDIFNPLTEKSQSFEDFFVDETPFEAKEVVCFTQHKDGRFVFLTKNKNLVTYDGTFRSIPIAIEFFSIFDMKWGPNNQIWLEYFSSSQKEKAILSAFDSLGVKTHEFIHEEYSFVNILDFNDDGDIQYILANKKKGHLNIPMIGYTTSSQSKSYPEKMFFPPSVSQQLPTAMGLIFEKLGSFYYIYADQKMKVFNPDAKNKYASIAELDIPLATDIIISQNKGIWISSQFGLYKVSINENQFTKFLYESDDQLRDKNAIRNMVTDNEGHLWAVIEGLYDLWKINLSNGEVTTVNSLQQSVKQFEVGYPSVVLTKSQTGHLWLQHLDTIIKFDPETLNYESFFTGYYKGDYGHLWVVYEDDLGKLWYTSDKGGIGILENGHAKWLPTPVDEVVPNYLYYFHKDQKGPFWLATENGLLVLDQKTGKTLERYWSGGSGKYYLPFDNIYHFHEEKDGTFWLGTAGTGLVHWNKGEPLPGIKHEPKLYQQYSRAHGLNNVVYAVYEDQQNNLWLSSDNGIIRFNKSSKQTKTYLEEDGITHHEFNRVSHFQANNRQLFFGGLNGITAFDPQDFAMDTNRIHAPLIITGFQQFDSEGNSLENAEIELKRNNSIVFRSDDRFFRLEFALLNYEDVEKNLYAYQLQGIDKDWTYQKEKFIRFSSLPYGRHTLRIKGQSGNGQ